MVEKRKQQNRRNEEAARIALEAHRAKKKRLANAEMDRMRRNMMRQINTAGTMLGMNVRGTLVEPKYQRMVAKVMRQATYTPTDFKQLGKIVRARLNRKWVEVERLIKEWEGMVKRRVCRLKKKDMANIAAGLNIAVNAKKKRGQLCQEIKNKI